jgi:hypothetical protein
MMLYHLQAGSQHFQGEELVWDGKNSEFSVFDLEQVLEATDHFSEENKLGQGGFGAVYKVNYCIGKIHICLCDFFHLFGIIQQSKPARQVGISTYPRLVNGKRLNK